MEWCVPLQKMEVGKIRIGNLISRLHKEKKPLAPLAYMDGQIVMPVLSILMPHLTVESYTPTNGRLVLTIDSPWITNKLMALQNSLISAMDANQHAWFGKKLFHLNDTSSLFQPMVDGNKLHLYCPSTLVEKKKGGGTIKVWKDENWIEGVRPGLLVPGQRIRVALQIQGVSLQLGNLDGTWTGRSRLQHRILGILIQTPKSSG